MRFAFATIPAGTLDEAVGLVTEAEALGYDQAWVPDQTFFRDAYVLLAVLAQRTSRIGLGIGVTNPYTRHPAMTARAAATLDELSGGRVTLGIGAGNRRELLDPLGYGQAKAAQRCRETALVIRQLVRGEEVRFRSETLVADGIRLEFPTVRPLPVFLAARGIHILEAAGEVADGVIVGALVSEQGIAYARDRIQAGANKVGRSLTGFEFVSWVTTILTDDRPKTVQALKPVIAHIVGGASEDTLDAVGIPRQVAVGIKTVYRAEGPQRAASMVPDGLVDELALVGDAGYIVDRIGMLRQFGVTQLSMLLPARGEHGSHAIKDIDHREKLRRFAAEVIRRFR